MKRILIKSIQLKNFKKIKDLHTNFGKTTTISAVNGAGKTTIADAFTYALFGKMADGSQPDKIRPHDENGVDVDHVEVTAIVTLEVDDKEYAIERTQYQDWSKDGVFKGNRTKIVINDIPYKEKEYKEFLDGILKEEDFRTYTSADYLLNMKTADKRKALVDLASDLTDEDVIATNVGKFGRLKPLLEDASAEKLIARDQKRITELEKKKKELPTRIDQESKHIEDIAEMELACNALVEQISELDKQESGFSSKMEEWNKANEDLMSLNKKKQEIENAVNDQSSQLRAGIQRKINSLNNEIRNNQDKIAMHESELNREEMLVNSNKQYKDKLLSQYKEEKSRMFDESSKNCPYCGQELPHDKISEMVAEFETKKAGKLNEINKAGKDVQIGIQKGEEKIAQYKKDIEDLQNGIEQLNQEKQAEEAKLADIKEPDLSINQEYVSLCEEIQKKQEFIANMDTGAEERSQIKNKRLGLREELAGYREKIKSSQSAMEEVENLKAEQKKVAQQIADVEQELELLKDFNKQKYSMLTDKVNKHFKLVVWKLFEQQVNGDFKEICEPTIGGTLYGKGLNSGHKMLAKLDIVSTLQEINGVSVPIFLDNAERLSGSSLDNAEKIISSQLIMLRVSEDKELKVEVQK
ncbi:MAG: hypothetical protein KH020_10775 [Clostridiales bacterium]|nr:hypothetical protein [Clostridiales bacterium]